MPSGTAVNASPTLWIRSASSATLSVSTKRRAWADATTPSTPKLAATARTPARERTIDGSTRPCE